MRIKALNEIKGVSTVGVREAFCTNPFSTRRSILLFFVASILTLHYIVTGFVSTLAASIFLFLLLLVAYTIAKTYNIIAPNRLVAKRIFLDRVVAGKPQSVEIIVKNEALIPIYNLYVEDSPPSYFTYNLRRCLLTVLPKTEMLCSYKVIPRVGLHEFGDITLYMCDPLELFCSKCIFRARRFVSSSPPIIPSRPRFFSQQRLLAGVASVRQRGLGTIFYSVREYQQGDEIRFVDWKHSAKTYPLKLFIKEFEQEASRNIVIVVALSNKSFLVIDNKSPIDLILRDTTGFVASLSQGLDKVSFAIAAPGYYSSTRLTKGRKLLKEYVELVSKFMWPEPEYVLSNEAGIIPPSLELLVKQKLPLVIGNNKVWVLLIYHITGFETAKSVVERIYDAYFSLAKRRHALSVILAYGMFEKYLDMAAEIVARAIALELRAKGIPTDLVRVANLEKKLGSMITHLPLLGI